MRVEGYAGCLERVILGERDEAIQDLRYGLPKIYLPRTPVNKGKKKDRGWHASALCST